MNRYGIFINHFDEWSCAGYDLVGLYKGIEDVEGAIKNFNEHTLVGYDCADTVINIIDFKLSKFIHPNKELDSLNLYDSDTWKDIDIKGQGSEYFK